MEKDAAGCPSLPSHYGLTNPGISRYLANRLPYLTSSSEGAGKQQCFPATRLLDPLTHRRFANVLHQSVHPLVRSKLTKLRDERTEPPVFRSLVRDLAVLLCQEATADLSMRQSR